MKHEVTLPLNEPGAYKDLLRQLLFDSEPLKALIKHPQDITGSITLDDWLTRYCLDVPYLDEQITDERSLILIECLPLSSGNICHYSLSITACCHRNLINLSAETRASYLSQYGLTGNLVDMMMSTICQTLSSETAAKNFGIGKLRLAPEKPVTSFTPNNRFYGKTVTFELYEMKNSR